MLAELLAHVLARAVMETLAPRPALHLPRRDADMSRALVRSGAAFQACLHCSTRIPAKCSRLGVSPPSLCLSQPLPHSCPLNGAG